MSIIIQAIDSILLHAPRSKNKDHAFSYLQFFDSDVKVSIGGKLNFVLSLSSS